MKIQVIEDNEGFTRLQPVWNKLLDKSENGSFFQSYTWLREWWDNFGSANNLQMHILVFSKDDKIVAIVPLVLMGNTFMGIKFRTLRFMGTTSTKTASRNLFDEMFSIDNTPGWCDQCDFIPDHGANFGEVIEAFWSHLMEWKDWDIIDLRELDAKSPTLTYLRKKSSSNNNILIAGRSMHPSYSIQLKGEYREYFKTLSRNTKSNFRKARNRIRRNGGASYHIAKTPEEVAKVVPLLQVIEERSWKGDKNKGAFSEKNNREFHLSVADKLSVKSEMEIHYLTINDRLVCYFYSFLFKGKLYLHNTAYDPDFSYLMPSFYTNFLIIENAFQRGIQKVDFCRAETFYKTRFNPVQSPRIWWTLYSQRLIPRLLYWIEFKLRPLLKSCLKYRKKNRNNTHLRMFHNPRF